MFTTTEPFLSAELAYRREQMLPDRHTVSASRGWRLRAFAVPWRRTAYRPVASH